MSRIKSLAAGTLALFMLALPAAAQQQQAPPTQAEKPKPKAKKVWTNDDIGSVREPADEYADQKAAEAERLKLERQKAAAGSAAQRKTPAEKDYLPKTLEDAEKLAAAKHYEIGQQHEAIDLAKQEQAQATTDAARAAFQKRIDTLTATLEESLAEMRALDARLQELKANPPPPPPPKPAASAEGSPAQALEALEKQIAEKQEKIEHLTGYVQPLRDAIAAANSDSARAPLQQKLDGFLALIEKENVELKTLEGRLQELKSAPPAPPKPAAPKP